MNRFLAGLRLEVKQTIESISRAPIWKSFCSLWAYSWIQVNSTWPPILSKPEISEASSFLWLKFAFYIRIFSQHSEENLI